MHNRCSHSGLTRWDVLALLAFLLVVAAILGPGIRPHRRENARRASCQSNMKQLGLAFVQYEQDADGQTPPGVNAAGNGWAGQIYPYVKATSTYHCPDDQQDGSYVSYAENRNTVHQPQAKFADPAATVQLYEMTTLNCDPSTAETVSGTGLSAPQDSQRHDEQGFSLNFLAADCHARYLKPEGVSSGSGALPTRKVTHSRGPALLTFSVK